MELRERRPETLKEKLRAKYHERDFSPAKDYTSEFSMGFFFVMVLTLMYECLMHLLPAVYPESRWVMSLVLVVMFVETVINYHRTYFDVDNYVRPETKKKYFPELEDTPQNWKSCLKCQVDAPPRSHHCNHCGKCMLKRDHHCFLTGSCIGFHNQKFFYSFLIWAAISSAFCIYLQLTYLNQSLPMNTSDIIAYIAPVTLHKWVMGYITFGQMLIVFHLYLTVFCFLTSGFFIFWQTMLITHGYTSHEAWKGIQVFREPTLMANINSVFGSALYIPVLLVWPVRFSQPGDGIQWTLRFKRVKGQ